MLTRLPRYVIISRSDAFITAKRFNSRAEVEEDEFRVFDLRNRKKKETAEDLKYTRAPLPPPRESQMPVDQDWSNVWPGPKTFHPASVPLPLRQGYDQTLKRIPPGKYANAELMKLPNFLHLTPPAIKKHCDALKKFCTPWPENLQDDEQIDKHFPLQVITTDYCHASPKIRDPKARVVSFKFKLSNLSLNPHAKDKMLRLLGDRHNDETGVVTLVADRCPLRKQNYDYNQYLILATFYESWNTEPWESEKSEEDMEFYDWDKSRSRQSFLSLMEWNNRNSSKRNNAEISDSSSSSSGTTDYEGVPSNKENILPEYKEAVTQLFTEGDSTQRVFKYKESVLKLLF